MGKAVKKLKEIFLPDISAAEKREMDRETVKNIRTVAKIACVIETLTLLTFALSVRTIDASARISMVSVAFCVALCLSAVLITGSIQKRDAYNHYGVLVFSAAFFLMLAAWGGWVSFRHYVSGEQMITFYVIMVCVVCFVTFYPLVGALLVAMCFGAFYLTLFLHDGGADMVFFNYITFGVICCALIIVRFHRQLETVRKALSLEETNNKLQYISRHDALSGLRNRAAFAEDQEKFFGKTITILLSDINYFKDINDTHGHVVGDAAIVAVGKFIREYFPAADAYRYGGDEFLLIIEGARTDMFEFVSSESRGFSIPVKEGNLIIDISFGTATGSPADKTELRRLIAEADEELYMIKKEIHKDDDADQAPVSTDN